jgi:hypothetical protein
LCNVVTVSMFWCNLVFLSVVAAKRSSSSLIHFCSIHAKKRVKIIFVQSKWTDFLWLFCSKQLIMERLKTAKEKYVGSNFERNKWHNTITWNSFLVKNKMNKTSCLGKMQTMNFAVRVPGGASTWFLWNQFRSSPTAILWVLQGYIKFNKDILFWLNKWTKRSVSYLVQEIYVKLI